MQTRKGQSIEDESMRIIDAEVGRHTYDDKQWSIVRRIIHSTADFDFMDKNRVIFHKYAVEMGINALKNGKGIVVDVNGVAGLLNKQNLAEFDNKLVCKISDPTIAELAKNNNQTRSEMSMLQSKEDIDGGVVVIGNAPTALLQVIKMIKEEVAKPALVIGVPVGFVCAVEAKEELQKISTPFITNLGRKGGSSTAAAIVNALFKILRESLS